jgi:hypothetical protein
MYSAKEEERGAENEKPAVNAFSPQRGDEMKRHAKAVLDKWGFRAVWGVFIVTSILFVNKLAGLLCVHTV